MPQLSFIDSWPKCSNCSCLASLMHSQIIPKSIEISCSQKLPKHVKIPKSKHAKMIKTYQKTAVANWFCQGFSIVLKNILEHFRHTSKENIYHSRLTSTQCCFQHEISTASLNHWHQGPLYNCKPWRWVGTPKQRRALKRIIFPKHLLRFCRGDSEGYHENMLGTRHLGENFQILVIEESCALLPVLFASWIPWTSFSWLAPLQTYRPLLVVWFAASQCLVATLDHCWTWGPR